MLTVFLGSPISKSKLNEGNVRMTIVRSCSRQLFPRDIDWARFPATLICTRARGNITWAHKTASKPS